MEAPAKSGWNRPGRAMAKTATQKSRAMWGILAMLAVIAAVLIGVWWLLPTNESPAALPRHSASIKKPHQMRPAKTVPAPKLDAKPESKDHSAVRKNPEDFVLERPEVQRAASPVNLAKYEANANRIFRTTAEQLISWVASVEPGEMPFPMPELDAKDRENLASILISKNEILDSDSEKLANLKQSVDYAKKEMSKYIRAGGDPDDFLQYYHRELLKAYELRCEAYKQIDAIIDDDPELGREFMKKVNEKFAEQGIKQFEKEEFE
ncbi:MAG: hypothetical protein IKJ45_07240 [Kiritimatiellae bacterium]|nr:hypothetical protein [Kiritimatiellia bacterium]